MFTRGHKINLGRKYSKERNLKVAMSKLGEKNPAWKGNGVSYKSLHSWISRYKKRVIFCEKCKSAGVKLELANISKSYRRNLDDYLWLCRSCHRKFDNYHPSICFLLSRLGRKNGDRQKEIARRTQKLRWKKWRLAHGITIKTNEV